MPACKRIQNTFMVMSWNACRVNAKSCRDILERTVQCLGRAVVLLQEVSSWSQDVKSARLVSISRKWKLLCSCFTNIICITTPFFSWRAILCRDLGGQRVLLECVLS